MSKPTQWTDARFRSRFVYTRRRLMSEMSLSKLPTQSVPSKSRGGADMKLPKRIGSRGGDAPKQDARTEVAPRPRCWTITWAEAPRASTLRLFGGRVKSRARHPLTITDGDAPRFKKR